MQSRLAIPGGHAARSLSCLSGGQGPVWTTDGKLPVRVKVLHRGSRRAVSSQWAAGTLRSCDFAPKRQQTRGKWHTSLWNRNGDSTHSGPILSFQTSEHTLEVTGKGLDLRFPGHQVAGSGLSHHLLPSKDLAQEPLFPDDELL